MKTSMKRKLLILFLMSVTVLSFAKPGPGEDDIFKHQKVEKDDFLEIKVEPKKTDLKKGVNKNLEDVKGRKKEALEKKDALQKKVLDERKKALEELENKKKGPKKPEKKPEVKPLPKAKPSVKDKPELKKKPAKEKLEEKKEPVQEEIIDIKTEEATLEKNISIREKFLNFCMGLKGIKYVWGGKTPSPGFDCSGLVSYGAKKSIGVNLTGNAQDIYNQTEHISLSEAVPGDLVFFKAAGDSRISHVGIYLGQNQGSNDFGNQNLFLNSASAGPRTGVIVSGMDENYWKKTYYGCGRFLDKI